MNKVFITTLLLCTGLITVGCEKTYSVAEFKKDRKLMEEWNAKCGLVGTGKNCENLRLAGLELRKEYDAKAEERLRADEERIRISREKAKAELDARMKKMRAETQKMLEEQRKRERAAEERRAKEQNND
ncbi:EexN family lipoprotein [Bartonella queenslandensis]|uniref:EexN family lipoprotein n=1 Tax=Bartonella queenslandensis TaxID=481138 RepID=UPI00031FFAEB|nr:EexN family lipoprotein [Bartonella queenslandensis]